MPFPQIKIPKLKKENTYLIVGGVLAVVGIAWWIFTGLTTTTYSTDTVLSGNQSVSKSEKIVLENDAKLTIKGNITVDGKLKCKDGALDLVVEGDLTVNGGIECERGDGDLPEGDPGQGIMIVAKGNLTFSDDSVMVSDGNVQIVDDEKNLAKTKEEVDEIFEETAENTGEEEFRLGPFTTEGERESAALSTENPLVYSYDSYGGFEDTEAQYAGAGGNLLVRSAKAAIPVWRFGGDLIIGIGGKAPPEINLRGLDPKKLRKAGIRRIILNFNFGRNGNMNLQNFTVVGPNGEDGKEHTGECTVEGKPGKPAMRFRGRARKMKLDNFNLYMGDGGRGGYAETSDNCDPGTATGGDGGPGGNFKLTTSKGIQINSFNLFPGAGGRGGDAVAHGKVGEDACPGKKGGKAIATGGVGHDAMDTIWSWGNVNGLGNMVVGPLIGGDGGDATANPGKGGDGNACRCDGGPAGKGDSLGGRGGHTFLDTPAGVVHNGGADLPGWGGNATVNPAVGGSGGSCGVNEAFGGDGGKGTDSQAVEGLGGLGDGGATGEDGQHSMPGGNGGDGGDGCPPGDGGSGGSGEPDGSPGAPGKEICKKVPPPGTVIDNGGDAFVPGDDGGGDGSGNGGEVIVLQGGVGDFTGWKLLGGYSNKTVSSGSTERVFGWRFDAEGSDLRTEIIKLYFQNNGAGESEPWEYFDSIGIFFGDTLVARESVNSEGDWSESGSGYRKTFSELSPVVMDGATAEVSIEIVALDLIDSSNDGARWQISLPPDGIRAEDALGGRVLGPPSQIDSFFDVFVEVNVDSNPPPSPPPQGNFFFEILSVPEYAPVSNLTAGRQHHFILASDGNPDVTSFMPMTFRVFDPGGSLFWSTSILDPVLDCRGPTGCSTDGPVIPLEWGGQQMHMDVVDSGSSALFDQSFTPDIGSGG